MDRIYVIDDGAVVQQGSYEELLGVDGRFREIFSEQLSDGGGTMPPEQTVGV